MSSSARFSKSGRHGTAMPALQVGTWSQAEHEIRLGSACKLGLGELLQATGSRPLWRGLVPVVSAAGLAPQHSDRCGHSHAHGRGCSEAQRVQNMRLLSSCRCHLPKPCTHAQPWGWHAPEEADGQQALILHGLDGVCIIQERIQEVHAHAWNDMLGQVKGLGGLVLEQQAGLADEVDCDCIRGGRRPAGGARWLGPGLGRWW